MRVGNFSLMVVGATERDSGYVGLSHAQQYSLRLINHEPRRCDAQVTIDGKEIGTFRLDPHGTISLERSPDDHGKFTFYADNTADAVAAGLSKIEVPDRGLVQVKFMPEKHRLPTPTSVVRPKSFFRGRAGGQSAGGDMSFADESDFSPSEKTVGGITGLSGHSDQRFTTVGSMEYDPQFTTISLRLVLAAGGPRELKPTAIANPVPPPTMPRE